MGFSEVANPKYNLDIDRAVATYGHRIVASRGSVTHHGKVKMTPGGSSLPAWDASNPAVVSAWRQASAQFAQGASGNVAVLQDTAVRVNSVWAEVEYPALTANPSVTSITAINPETGASTLLWSRP
jgi:filamentous hemagglutinin